MARYNEASVQMPNVGTVSPVQTQSTKQIDLLSKDIGNLIGGSQKINAAAYEASDYATKLAAVDNANTTQQGFQQIYNNTIGDKLAKGEQPTSDDYQNMITWRTNFMKDRLTSVLGDSENQNDIYKEHFYKPTKELMDKLNTQDTMRMQSLFKSEQTEVAKKAIADNKYGMNADDINTLSGFLGKLGVKDAQSKLFNTAAINAINDFKIQDFNHVSKMVLTGKKAELLSENMLGRYLKYDKDGKLVAKTGVEDKASIAMKDAFTAAISHIKTKQSTAKETVTKSLSGLDLHTPIDAINKTIKASVEQLNILKISCQDGNNENNCKQFTKGYQSLQSMLQLQGQKLSLESGYKEFIDNPNMKLVDTPFTYNIFNKDGLPQTPKTDTLSQEQQASFFADTAFTDFNKALNGGDVEGARTAITVLASLGSKGYKSSKITDINNIFSSSTNMIQKVLDTTSYQELNTLLQSGVTYNATVHGEPSYLTKKVIDEVTTFHDDEMQMVKDGKLDENRKPITEQKVFNETKILYNMKVSRPKELMENSTRKAALILGIKPANAINSDAFDSLTKGWGWDIGTTKFPSGTIQSAMSYAINSGAGNREEVIKAMKTKLVKVDRTHLPIFGKSLALYNSTGLDEDTFKNHIGDVVKYNLGQLKELQHIDLTKLHSDNISIRQQPIYNSEEGKKQVITMIDISSDTEGKHTVLLTPEEITEGISDNEKLKYKDIFKDYNANVESRNRQQKNMKSIMRRRGRGR